MTAIYEAVKLLVKAKRNSLKVHWLAYQKAKAKVTNISDLVDLRGYEQMSVDEIKRHFNPPLIPASFWK